MGHHKNHHMAAAMAQKGLTVKELAKRAGINRATVSRVLNMRTVPHLLTAEAIARALDTTPEALCLYDPPNKNSDGYPFNDDG